MLIKLGLISENFDDQVFFIAKELWIIVLKCKGFIDF